MATPAYLDILAKLTRAEVRLKDFESHVKSYWESNPYEIDQVDDSSIGTRSYVVKSITPPSSDMRLAASEVLSHLRSALDNLAFQLVTKSLRGKNPDWNVYFPIAKTALDYPSHKKRCLRNITEEISRVFDELEPFKSGRGHNLWRLNKLCVADKHHLLIGANSSMTGLSLREIISSQLGPMELPDSMLKDVYLRPQGVGQELRVGDRLFTEPIPQGEGYRRFRITLVFKLPGEVMQIDALSLLREVSMSAATAVSSFNKFF